MAKKEVWLNISKSLISVNRNSKALILLCTNYICWFLPNILFKAYPVSFREKFWNKIFAGMPDNFADFLVIKITQTALVWVLFSHILLWGFILNCHLSFFWILFQIKWMDSALAPLTHCSLGLSIWLGKIRTTDSRKNATLPVELLWLIG